MHKSTHFLYRHTRHWFWHIRFKFRQNAELHTLNFIVWKDTTLVNLAYICLSSYNSQITWYETDIIFGLHHAERHVMRVVCAIAFNITAVGNITPVWNYAKNPTWRQTASRNFFILRQTVKYCSESFPHNVVDAEEDGYGQWGFNYYMGEKMWTEGKQHFECKLIHLRGFKDYWLANDIVSRLFVDSGMKAQFKWKMFKCQHAIALVATCNLPQWVSHSRDTCVVTSVFDLVCMWKSGHFRCHFGSDSLWRGDVTSRHLICCRQKCIPMMKYDSQSKLTIRLSNLLSWTRWFQYQQRFIPSG